MDEDEELIRKDSPLYCYLAENGFSNFESYELTSSDITKIQPSKETADEIHPPQWTVDYLTCVLKCGLLLEDHQHFIESLRPFEVQDERVSKLNFALCSVPLICLVGGLLRVAETSNLKKLVCGLSSVSAAFAFVLVKQRLTRYVNSCALRKFQITLASLEKLFLQLKRMLLLVRQNDFIPQNISFRRQEIQELKQKLFISLLSTTKKLFGFLSQLQEVPLSIEVDQALKSFSAEDLCFISSVDQENLSLECIQKLFNCYILVQSELLRRLALCFCPDFWTTSTLKAVLFYLHNHWLTIEEWSSRAHHNLVQEQRLFHAILESKDKLSVLRLPVSSRWDFSNLYVSLRSATAQFQSILYQMQNLQGIMESHNGVEEERNQSFVESMVPSLTQISKEIRSGQANIDSCVVQIYKMLNGKPLEGKLDTSEMEELTETKPILCLESISDAIIQDEVFEVTVPNEDLLVQSNDEEWDELSYKKKVKGETSKIVLQELKTVLVKKADEWREREKRALEMKGMSYSPPEQVPPTLPMHQGVSEDCGIECLSTSSENIWPLPRLKRGPPSHRLRTQNKSLQVGQLEHHMKGVLQLESGNDTEPLRLGFGASLLAEAIAKSKAMQDLAKEDIFVCSDDESISSENE